MKKEAFTTHKSLVFVTIRGKLLRDGCKGELLKDIGWGHQGTGECCQRIWLHF